MDAALFFEDINVGDSWESRGRTITQADVVGFAGLTGDFDPLHVDHDYASRTPFGRPIAHGLLGMAFVAGLGSTNPAVHTEAFVAVHEWRFLKPIYFGDTVRVINSVMDTQRRGRRRGTVRWKRQLLNQRGEIVQEGIFETLVASSAKLGVKSHLEADADAA